MMDVYDAAVKWGCSVTPVKRACKAGRIPGVQLLKVPGRNLPLYQIPDGTPRPEFINPRGRYNKTAKIAPAAIQSIVVHRAADDISNAEYIRQNQTKKTIGQLAKELKISSRRVTELFDLALVLFSAKEAAS